MNVEEQDSQFHTGEAQDDGNAVTHICEAFL